MKILKKVVAATVCMTLLIPGVAAAAEDVPEDTSALDDALELHWAKKREVKIIQKRLFMKDSRHEFTIFSGVIPNDEFFSYFPIGGRYDYYFQEDFALEIFGSYLVQVNSELQDFLEETSLEQIFVEIPQALEWLAGASILWSPLHGKFGAFTTKLVHFDVYLAFGAGIIGTKVVDADTREESSKFDPSANIGLGVRLYLTDLVSLRFDYRQYFYPAETGGLAYPAEITLGVSFFTAAPK